MWKGNARQRGSKEGSGQHKAEGNAVAKGGDKVVGTERQRAAGKQQRGNGERRQGRKEF